MAYRAWARTIAAYGNTRLQSAVQGDGHGSALALGLRPLTSSSELQGPDERKPYNSPFQGGTDALLAQAAHVECSVHEL